ncbi:unnamed protein product [Prunus armeniaca]
MHPVNFYFSRPRTNSTINQAYVHKGSKPRPSTSLSLFLKYSNWQKPKKYKLEGWKIRRFQQQKRQSFQHSPSPACARDVYTYIQKTHHAKFSIFTNSKRGHHMIKRRKKNGEKKSGAIHTSDFSSQFQHPYSSLQKERNQKWENPQKLMQTPSLLTIAPTKGGWVKMSGCLAAKSKSKTHRYEEPNKPLNRFKKLQDKRAYLVFVPYLTAHSCHDTWNTLKADTSSTGPYRMFVRYAVPIHRVDYAPSVPSLTFGMSPLAPAKWYHIGILSSVRIQPSLEPSDITDEGHPGPHPSAHL